MLWFSLEGYTWKPSKNDLAGNLSLLSYILFQRFVDNTSHLACKLFRFSTLKVPSHVTSFRLKHHFSQHSLGRRLTTPLFLSTKSYIFHPFFIIRNIQTHFSCRIFIILIRGITLPSSVLYPTIYLTSLLLHITAALTTSLSKFII